ncbi:MAG: FAD-dependent thymidylate synthase [Bacteroidales bacterium]
MQLVTQEYQILGKIDGKQILHSIEFAGRTCYKSEDKITSESAKEFIAMLIRRGHESVLEHEKLSVKFICDRGVSHELVRHRIASFSQESTRYCNYSKKGITFIIPNWITHEQIDLVQRLNEHNFTRIDETTKAWYAAMVQSEQAYDLLIKQGWKPEQARSVLPNSLKTEIVVTANIREWRTIFKQRTAPAAHPQMRELMVPLLACFKRMIPVVFDDILG